VGLEVDEVGRRILEAEKRSKMEAGGGIHKEKKSIG
jgi:hypothetical protein